MTGANWRFLAQVSILILWAVALAWGLSAVSAHLAAVAP